MDYLRTSQVETLEGSIGRIQVSILGMLCIVLTGCLWTFKKSWGIKVFAKSRELTIYADHPFGNLVYKTIKYDVMEEKPATKFIQTTWTDYKIRKIASPRSIHSHNFWSFPNGLSRTIWFSIRNFRFTHVNRELKQRRFWATPVNRKWAFFSFNQPWRYRIYIAKCLNSYRDDLRKNLFKITAQECKTSTSGWRASLKNVAA